MTPVSADVVIIRGAPGAGKSQAAKALTSFFPRGAKVEVDILRKMVISVDWKNQPEHINLLQVAARLTHDFINLGFRPVIVVDTFSGDKVNRFLETLRQFDGSVAIKTVGLYASDKVLRTRLEARPLDEFKDFEISKKLNKDVRKMKHLNEYQIDTSGLSPRQTAEDIYGRLFDQLALPRLRALPEQRAEARRAGGLAAEQAALLEKESAELEGQADKLAKEITELRGKSNLQ